MSRKESTDLDAAMPGPEVSTEETRASSMSGIEIWLNIFRSVCILHGTPNSDAGINECKKQADAVYLALTKKPADGDSARDNADSKDANDASEGVVS